MARVLESQETKLTYKQRIFAEKFLELNFNGFQAALIAGYSEKNAGVSASILLANPKVKAYIDKRKDELIDQIGVNQLKVLKELAHIAFADIRKLYDDQGQLRPVNTLTDDMAAALMCVDVFEVISFDGIKVGETKKIRMNDKIKALELLGRYLGLFEKDNKQKPADVVNIFDVTLNIT